MCWDVRGVSRLPTPNAVVEIALGGYGMLAEVLWHVPWLRYKTPWPQLPAACADVEVDQVRP